MTKAEWLQRYLVQNDALASFLTSVYAKLLNLKTETSRCPAQITDSTPTRTPAPPTGAAHIFQACARSATLHGVLFL